MEATWGKSWWGGVDVSIGVQSYQRGSWWTGQIPVWLPGHGRTPPVPGRHQRWDMGRGPAGCTDDSSRSTVARCWPSYKLQMVQSFLARAITKKQPSMYMFYTNIALIILAAHKAKIQFKIYVLGHKILYLNQLTYFRFLLTPCVSKYCSRHGLMSWRWYRLDFFKTRSGFHNKQIAYIFSFCSLVNGFMLENSLSSYLLLFL